MTSAELIVEARARLLSGDWARAVAQLQLAAVWSGDAAAYNELGSALSVGGSSAAAYQKHLQAAALDPTSGATQFLLAQTQQQLCLVEDAVKGYEGLLAANPGLIEAASYRACALNYLESDQAKILQATQDFAKLLPEQERPRETRPLRKVGFLSSSFRRHSNAYFLQAILQHAQSADIKVILYHDSPHQDDVTRSLGGCLKSVAGLDNDALLALIRSDDLDMLVEIDGHFSRNRLPVLAKRAAPNQVSYLGYPNTTGVPAIDWRLGDSFVDPAVHDAHFTEKVKRLKCLWAYMPLATAPNIAPRSRHGITYGYFGLLSKISAPVLAAWKMLLDVDVDATLLVKGDFLSEPQLFRLWREKFKAAGFDTARIILRAKTPTTEVHLDAYNDVDVALDTWPYNGTTTTCEALWMGVPVVTMLGSRHASRVGAALIPSAAVVATDAKGYVDSALDAAGLRFTRDELSDSCFWMQRSAVARNFWETLAELAEQP